MTFGGNKRRVDQHESVPDRTARDGLNDGGQRRHRVIDAGRGLRAIALRRRRENGLMVEGEPVEVVADRTVERVAAMIAQVVDDEFVIA